MGILDPFWLPTLIGNSIRVRPVAETDFEALYQAASDPEIWRQHSEKDRYTRPVFEQFFAKAARPPAALVIEDLKSKKIIGSSRYYGFDAERREIVVGYTFLETAYWGGATNFELKTLMLDHAFQKVGKVLFHASVENHRSRRAIEKLGATLRPNIVDLPGVGQRVEYTLTYEQWIKRKGV